MAFGRVIKYYQIQPADIATGGENISASWDQAVEDASEQFGHLVHNIFLNNCHHHVAVALNRLRFRGRTDWDTTKLILFMVMHSRFASIPRFVFVYLLYIVLVVLLVIFAGADLL